MSNIKKRKVYTKFKLYDPYTNDEYTGHIQIVNRKVYGISTSKPLIVIPIEKEAD